MSIKMLINLKDLVCTSNIDIVMLNVCMCRGKFLQVTLFKYCELFTGPLINGNDSRIVATCLSVNIAKMNMLVLVYDLCF
jgi:hypothetical protein